MKKVIVILLMLMIAIPFIKVSASEGTSVAGASEIKNSIDLLTERATPTNFQQRDSLWSYYTLGGGDIGSSACGLLSLVNTVNYLTGNFIEPINLADYAYSIGAYNGPIGGGTARYVLYRQLEDYEAKYGFKMRVLGREDNIDNPLVIESLEKGEVLIALVPGHFIGIMDYDKDTDSFLVYDCAANPVKRFSYPIPMWLSRDILKNSEYMKVSFFCTLSNESSGVVSFDEDGKYYYNSHKEYSYNVDNENNLIKVSGFAMDKRGIDSFYYTIDNDQTEHKLSSSARYYEHDLFKDVYSSNDPKTIGFKDSIDTSMLSNGSHYIIINGKTSDGGVRCVALLYVNKTSNTIVNKEERKITLDMSLFENQLYVEKVDDYYIFNGGSGSVINIGSYDFKLFKKAVITYSTSSVFTPTVGLNNSVIALKEYLYKVTINKSGKLVCDMDGVITYGNVLSKTLSNKNFSTITIDLEEVNYNGFAYLTCYNPHGDSINVKSIELYYHDEDYEFHNYVDATCTTPKTCLDCGKTVGEPLEHYYIDATCEHGKMCYLCGLELSEKVDHNFTLPSCEQPSYCIYCKMSVGEALGHNYEHKTIDATCQDFGRIFDECSNCHDKKNEERIDKLDHVLVHHEATKATCTSDGWDEYDNCINCPYSTKSVIEATGHKFIVVGIVDSTCEEEGHIEKKCKYCNEVDNSTLIDKLPHDLVHHDNKDATCTTKGHKEYDTCKNCSYSTYEEIPVLPHDYVSEEIKPTNKEGGHTIHTCKYCNDQYIDSYTNKLSKCSKKGIRLIIALLTSNTLLFILLKKMSKK